MYIQLTNPDLSQGWDGESTPLQSLGGYISSTQVPSSLLEATFVPAADYRCIAISTDGPSGRASNITLTLTGTGLAWALDPTPSSVWNSAEPQALTVPSPMTDPGDLPWSADPIHIDATDADAQALWIRRSPTGSAGDKTGELLATWTDDDGDQSTRITLAWTEPEPPPPPLPPASGAPVDDLWIGPLGALLRIHDAPVTWQRTRDLGAAEFESLEGRLTTSRSRWAPRRTSWSWDRLEPDAADVVAEVALNAHYTDTTVEVIDPAARNLLTTEQSRGRLMAAANSTEAAGDLYTVEGAGTVAIGLIDSSRYACVRDGATGDEVIWLHSYHGSAGWPLVPGMPVYLALGDLGTASIHAIARPRLAFLDRSGTLVGHAEAAAGAESVSADAPAGAVTVSPRAVLDDAFTGLRLIGPAALTYAPPPPDIALGDGCPTYAITAYTDAPALPYRSVSLELVEVRSHAPR
ncbi:hypothetical protein CDO52_00160 [Nocardiopsis gilva YIM 90087]|uniref:Uncharacterized protein n=1 Tax=Nocardiopsis gilva YIM 90087 TaxID=1235441 RepID=A0A223RZV4_9ACTN|nr:hypothetical protein [Nocardiopsis gilva]ASU81401.1 hypothetical protein CDO52_00160 [Nocardiopsis gilva YIM 90087]